ncbi:MAG: hypothetical protein KBD16_03395 [Candidatus Pacebacteria bacterium]|nr:hypothetical protein [Candidatus Paceibacterota bacterium]
MKPIKITFKKPNFTIETSWLISLVVVFLVTAGVIAYSILLFIRASKADTAQSETSTDVESVSREALTETVLEFEARVRRFESFRGGYTGTSDPSL